MSDLKAIFEGDEEYLSSESKSIAIELIRGNPNLKLTLPSGEFQKGEKITISLTSELEEKAPVDIYNNNSKIGTIIVNSNGSGNIETTLNDGVNTFNAKSPETPLHSAATSNSVSIDTSKRRTKIQFNISTIYVDIESAIEISLLRESDNSGVSGKTLKVSIDGVEYSKTTDNSGKIIINHTFTTNGTYSISATFSGDATYFSSSNSTNIIVNRIQPKVEVISKSEIYRGWYLRLKIVDNENQPLVGKTVRIRINGVDYDRTIDENGEAKLFIRLLPNTYSYTATVIASSTNDSKVYNGTLTVKESLIFETKPTGNGSILSQAESNRQKEWVGDYLGPSSDPYGSTNDNYFVRCGNSCRDGIASNSGTRRQPAPLYHYQFNWDNFPSDVAYIPWIEIVYIHRNPVCGNTVVNCGPGTVVLDNYLSSQGGTVHLEKKGVTNPGRGEWTQNNVGFYNEDLNLTSETLKENKLRVGLKYDINSTGNVGLLDVGWVSVKIEYSPKEEI